MDPNHDMNREPASEQQTAGMPEDANGEEGKNPQDPSGDAPETPEAGDNQDPVVKTTKEERDGRSRKEQGVKPPSGEKLTAMEKEIAELRAERNQEKVEKLTTSMLNDYGVNSSDFDSWKEALKTEEDKLIERNFTPVEAREYALKLILPSVASQLQAETKRAVSLPPSSDYIPGTEPESIKYPRPSADEYKTLFNRKERELGSYTKAVEYVDGLNSYWEKKGMKPYIV